MFEEDELRNENELDDNMPDEDEAEVEEAFDESFIELEDDMPEELKNVISKFNQQHEKVLVNLKNGSNQSENRLVSDDDDDDDQNDYDSSDSNLVSDDISETDTEISLDDIF